MPHAPPQPSCRHPANSGRPAFTLVELCLSLGVMSILLAAIASTLVFASRSLPSANTGAASELAGPVERMLAELSLATRVTAATTTSITFTTADRNADSIPETIVYAWSGSGSPITRKLNAAPPVAVSPPLARYQFALTTESAFEPVTGAPADGLEELLAAYAGSAGSTYDTGIGLWVAQYFQPLLPADATAYSVTRVRAYARRKNSGTSTWGIRNDNAGTPAALAIQSRSVASGSLSATDNWHQVTFNGVTGVDPGDGLWLVIGQVSGTSCTVSGAPSNVPSRRGRLATSTNLGLLWSHSSSGSIVFEVYGHVRRPATVWELSTRADAVTIACQGVEGGDIYRTSTRFTGHPISVVQSDPGDPPEGNILRGLLGLLLGGG